MSYIKHQNLFKQARGSLKKVPSTEEAIVETHLPTLNLDKPLFYQKLYDVVNDGVEPIVKNKEVRKVIRLIDADFKHPTI